MQLKFENQWSGKTTMGLKWTEGIGNVRIGLKIRRVMKEHSERLHLSDLGMRITFERNLKVKKIHQF